MTSSTCTRRSFEARARPQVDGVNLNAIDATSDSYDMSSYAPCHLSDDVEASPSAASAAAARAASAEAAAAAANAASAVSSSRGPCVRAAAARSLTSIAWFMSTQSKDA